MNQPDPKTTRKNLHPLIAAAAAGVIVASLAATAAITGVFPKASGNAEQNAQTQTGQTTAMASQPVVDSTQPAPAAQVAQNNAPAEPQVQQQPNPQVAQQAPGAPTAPPPQYGQQYAQQPGQQQYAQEGQPAQAACESCGTVEAISAVKHEGHGTGIGAVGGAVAGGLIGNQFGRGTGRTAMTLLGALGGGVAGNSVEKHIRSTTSYSVRVHMESGKTRYFTYHDAPPFQQGERVRVENGTLVAA
jgi:outer membrane lipoprotein SlyB